ncbi:hypothetical protein JYK21_04190 [Ralstonia pickettii]|nr:hypothetical protein [Ralstonia pickettii]
MRIILFVLLLTVCFLSGVLYATNQQTTAKEEQLTENTVVETEVELPQGNQEIEAAEIIPAQNIDTPAFQAASALETVVSFFYEIIVDILYQVSKLFY